MNWNDQFITSKKSISFARERIMPVMLLQMPARKGKPSQWLEFPLGVYLASTPKETTQDGLTFLDVEAYDVLKVLQDDKFMTRYVVKAGTSYTDAIEKILKDAGIDSYNIESSARVLANDLTWEIGTSRLDAANDLASAINYTPIYTDENGFFISRPYLTPAERPVSVTYETNEFSVIQDGTEYELDLFDVPNRWVIVLNDPEREPITTVIENTDPNSPTSYQARGNRWITDFREVTDIADQDALDRYAERLRQEASQVYGYLKFQTAIIPIHGYQDILRMVHNDAGIDDVFTETNWSIPFQPGGIMSHQARRVNIID